MRLNENSSIMNLRAAESTRFTIFPKASKTHTVQMVSKYVKVD